MKPLFVGYYTPGAYEKDFRSLRESLEGFDLEYDYRCVESLGSWQANTQMKAEVVRDFMEKYPTRRLVYVDVDSIVVARPVLFETLEADIAAVMFREVVLASGVVMFSPTEKARRVVDRWIEINRQYPVKLPDGRDAWDQRTLLIAIQQTGCAFAPLPIGYNWMPGKALTQGFYPDERAVIVATRGALKHQEDVDAGTDAG